MRETLFYIPTEIAGLPLVGFGLLLGIWILGSIAGLAWLYRRHKDAAEIRSYLPGILVMAGVIAFLLPRLAIQSGFNAADQPTFGVPIRGYGAMLLLAVVSGVALGVYRGRKRGISSDVMLSLAFWLFLSGIVGARVFFVIQKWPQFDKPTLRETLIGIISINEGGLVVFGSLIGAGLAAVVFAAKHKLNWLVLGDVLAPAMLLGQAIGRIGCLMMGCCFGGICDAPFAVTFPIGSPPYNDQVARGLIEPLGITLESAPGTGAAMVTEIAADSPFAGSGLQVGDRILQINAQPPVEAGLSAQEARLRLSNSFFPQGPLTIQTDRQSEPIAVRLPEVAPRSLGVHPTQIYSAIDAFLLMGLLLAVEPVVRRPGILVALMLTVHSVSRFLLEIIRIDEAGALGTSLSISQNLSILMLAVALLLWCYIFSRKVPTAS